MSQRNTKRPSSSFHRYAVAVVVMTIFLIWWGAATTTEEVGMVFPDWPLSLGSINPPGWLEHLGPFLEHSHRIIAAAVGLMTLILFAWAFVRSWPNLAEVILLVVVLAVITGLVRMGGAERQDHDRKMLLLWSATAAGFLPVLWLVGSWFWREWPLTVKLSALALLTVTLQAILGGLRVTEISDHFAVVHGTLAQVFFCLVLLIAMSSARSWVRAPVRDSLGEGQRTPIRIGSALLVMAIFIQLILGALMRHHHRHGLIDTEILQTRGMWVPPFEPLVLGILFLHKYWAVAIFLMAAFLTLLLWTRRPAPVPLLRHSLAIFGLLVVQIALGVSILLTGDSEHKSFWITNFHVLNGLAILALAFTLAVRCLRAERKRTLLADASEPLPEPAS